MAAPLARPTWNSSRLVVLVLLALVAGIVASLLIGTAPTPPRPRAGELIIDLPSDVWGLLLLSPLLLGLAGILVQRALHPSGVNRKIFLLGAVVLVLLLVLFIFLLSLGGGSGGYGVGSVGIVSPVTPSNNSTGTSTGGSGGGGVPPTTMYTFSLPSWTLTAVVVGLGVVAAALTVPGVISRIVDRRLPRIRDHPPEREEIAAAMSAAAAAIERGDDPRETIVRLYGHLLHDIGPKVGDVDPLTADEIGGRLVSDLGVRANASQALTRLFEEARYSTHPMGPESANRCRDAIGYVMGDLSRSARPA